MLSIVYNTIEKISNYFFEEIDFQHFLYRLCNICVILKITYLD